MRGTRAVEPAAQAALCSAPSTALELGYGWRDLLRGDLWMVWVALGIFAALWLIFYRRRDTTPLPIVAGARWVGLSGGHQVVRLYELTMVRDTPPDPGDGPAPPPQIVLTDRHQQVTLDRELLEINRELWALVYNGIRYSVAGGARIDPETRQRLRLPTDR